MIQHRTTGIGLLTCTLQGTTLPQRALQGRCMCLGGTMTTPNTWTLWNSTHLKTTPGGSLFNKSIYFLKPLLLFRVAGGSEVETNPGWGANIAGHTHKLFTPMANLVILVYLSIFLDCEVTIWVPGGNPMAHKSSCAAETQTLAPEVSSDRTNHCATMPPFFDDYVRICFKSHIGKYPPKMWPLFWKPYAECRQLQLQL